MGKIGGSVEQEIGRRESEQGSKKSNLRGIELLPHGIEEQERSCAEKGVDESWHAKQHSDRQEERPSWRIFAVVSTVIDNMDMFKELTISWRGDGESPMAENVRLHQI